MQNNNSSVSEEEISRANKFILSFILLRRIVGWVALSIAPVLLAITFFNGDCEEIQDSISHYYYTMAGDVFVGLLCAVAFFLIVYPGHEAKDNRLTNLAGILALGIAFFPTNPMTSGGCSVMAIELRTWSQSMHNICAGSFFITLSYLAYYVFTKSKLTKEFQWKDKKICNKIYRWCARIMMVCVIIIGLTFIPGEIEAISEKYNLVFWFEVIALMAFGICWLVKGKMLNKIMGWPSQ